MSFYHTVNDSSERPLILGAFDRQDHINSVHEMMPWHIILTGEPKQLELLLDAILLHFDVFIVHATL